MDDRIEALVGKTMTAGENRDIAIAGPPSALTDVSTRSTPSARSWGSAAKSRRQPMPSFTRATDIADGLRNRFCK